MPLAGGLVAGWSHLKMLIHMNEIYYDWNTDSLSTEWMGCEREKNAIYHVPLDYIIKIENSFKTIRINLDNPD